MLQPLGFPLPSSFQGRYFIFLLEGAPSARCKSLLAVPAVCGVPVPPLRLPPRGPAQTSPRHGQDLSPLDHPEHYWGLKVASARRAARPPPARPPAGGGRRWVALSPLPGARGEVSPTRHQRLSPRTPG